MPVSFKIISYKGQPYQGDDVVVIDQEGGSIGRLDSCELALPDAEKTISRHHATVSYEDGVFILADTSLAGTYIDEDPEPLHNASIELLDGMMLRIGDYQIQVSLQQESQEGFPDFLSEDSTSMPFSESEPSPFSGPEASPFADDDALLNLSASKEQESPLLEEDESILESDELNPFAEPPRDESFISSAESNDNFSTLHDSFIPPEPSGERVASNEIPEDFNFEELFNIDSESPSPEQVTEAKGSEQANELNALLDGQLPETPEQPLPEPAVAGAVESTAPEPPLVQTGPSSVNGAGGDLYRAFLSGAELTQQGDLNPEQQLDRMNRIGSMFRQFVESTVAVLRSRAEFKSLFRVSVTTIKKADNNPLKFSVTTEEALQHLFNDGQGGFKKSVDAIDEGFQDLLNHQMAIQAGIQASLLEILRQFDPDRIEKQYEEGLVLNKKAKCWDKYREVYNQMAEHAIDDFYGDSFADAYEKQMKQIMAINQKQH